MFKIITNLIVAFSITTVQAADPIKVIEPSKPAKAATASSAATAVEAAKAGTSAKAVNNSGAETAGKAEIKVVCHNKVKEGKTIIKDGKPEQECKKIKTHTNLEAHDIPPVNN